MSTYSTQNIYTIYSSIHEHYTIFRNCLNNIYVTLPGTIMHIFSNSDKIERILA